MCLQCAMHQRCYYSGSMNIKKTKKPAPDRHAKKHSLGLAGEFLVAGELLRRGITAAVTYGNAKKADVVAVHGTKAVALEVKTTSQPKWVLGNALPAECGAIWVLVYLPTDMADSPVYFVFTGTELRELVLPGHEAYNTRFRVKHGKDFEGKGVVSISRNLMDLQHQGAWHKVDRALGLATSHIRPVD